MTELKEEDEPASDEWIALIHLVIEPDIWCGANFHFLRTRNIFPGLLLFFSLSFPFFVSLIIQLYYKRTAISYFLQYWPDCLLISLPWKECRATMLSNQKKGHCSSPHLNHRRMVEYLNSTCSTNTISTTHRWRWWFAMFPSPFPLSCSSLIDHTQQRLQMLLERQQVHNMYFNPQTLKVPSPPPKTEEDGALVLLVLCVSIIRSK